MFEEEGSDDEDEEGSDDEEEEDEDDVSTGEVAPVQHIAAAATATATSTAATNAATAAATADVSDDDDLALVAAQYGARLDRVLARIKGEQQALLRAARTAAAADDDDDTATTADAARARIRTRATVAETTSPLRTALRLLAKSRLALLAVVLLVAFRLHASLLSGGLR